MELIIGNILINDIVRIYLLSDVRAELFPDIKEKVIDRIKPYMGINSYIDSIYIYSETNQTICSSTGEVSINDFNEKEFLTKYNNFNDEHIWMRKIENRFPYYLTFLKKVRDSEASGAVVVNINIPKFLEKICSFDNRSEAIYLIGENNLTYHYNKNFIINNEIAILKELSNINNESILKKIDNISYVIAARKSKYYSWQFCNAAPIYEYQEKMKNVWGYYTILNVIMILFGIVIAFLISLTAFAPIKNLMDILEEPNDWENKIGRNNEVKYVATKILTLLTANNQLKTELEKNLLSLNDAQILALQTQMNPHFLYNTLNMVNWKIMDESGYDCQSSKMVTYLSKILRFSVDTENILIPLQEELKYVDIYAELLKARYDGMFILEKNIDTSLLKYKVVKLSVQPIIENSIYHGISGKKDGIITISISDSQDNIIVSVADNGRGMSFEAINNLNNSLNKNQFSSSEHIGLNNLKYRYNILFGDKSNIIVKENEHGGIKIVITFPKIT